MKILVTKDQLWSLMDDTTHYGGLMRRVYIVDRIDGSNAILKALHGGKERTVSLSVLWRGRRGARLTRQADGTPVERPATRPPPKAHARALRAVRMVAKGLTIRSIAEHFDVSDSTVRNWITNARRAARS